MSDRDDTSQGQRVLGQLSEEYGDSRPNEQRKLNSQCPLPALHFLSILAYWQTQVLSIQLLRRVTKQCLPDRRSSREIVPGPSGIVCSFGLGFLILLIALARHL